MSKNVNVTYKVAVSTLPEQIHQQVAQHMLHFSSHPKLQNVQMTFSMFLRSQDYTSEVKATLFEKLKKIPKKLKILLQKFLIKLITLLLKSKLIITTYWYRQLMFVVFRSIWQRLGSFFAE